MTQARRRLDEVLDPDFVLGLDDLDLDSLRHRRGLADEVENELSYYRRLLHGRIDLLRFEQRRRSGEEQRSLIDALPEILADGPSGGRRHPAHLSTDLPPLPDVGRRDIDRLLGDDVLLRIDEVTDDEVAAAIEAMGEMATEVSDSRRQVQAVADTLAEAVTARYRSDSSS